MKWYEWVLVLVIVFVSVGISSTYLYREIHKPIYVVDLGKLIDNQFSEDMIMKVYNKEISPEKFLEERKKYLDKIQSILESLDRPVFVKQAVLGGNIIDITDEVEKYLK